MQNKKKTAPQKQKAIKDEVMEAALTIFAQLPKAKKQIFLAWAKLYFYNDEFREAYINRFGECPLDDVIIADVEAFVYGWKGVAV